MNRHLAPTLLALGLATAAPAAPPFDPGREAVLLGTSVTPKKVDRSGRWKVEPGHVAPRGARGIWMPDVELLDGTVRAVFHNPQTLDATLLMRAETNRRGSAVLDGIGVHIRGRRLTLVRRKGGENKPIARRTRTQRKNDLEAIEVLMGAYGPHLVVSVFDARDRTHLATVVADDVPVKLGTVGVVSGPRWKTPAALEHLSYRTACENTPPQVSSASKVVFHTTAEAAAGARGETLEADGDAVVFRTDVIGFEHMFCAGQPVLDLVSELPWKYRDSTYLQFRHRPPVETPTGFRLDLSYKNPEMIEALLRGYARRFPRQTRLEQIGTSHEGRAIWAMAVADDVEQAHDRPAVLLNGAHHGSELLSPEFVLDALQILVERQQDPKVQRWLRELVIWIVPQVNPDGAMVHLERTSRTGRKNGRDFDGDGVREPGEGVDLNRNYPFRWGSLGERGSRSVARSAWYRGKHAASEPETQAMIDLARREQFVAAISFHTGTIALLAPYTIDRVKNPEPNEAWTVAEEIAAQLQKHPQNDREFPVRRNLYSVDGVDQDWHRFAHGTLALLVEGAIWTPRAMGDRNAIVEVVRPSWQILLDRLVNGPVVHGRVLDAEGRPVQAEVRVREVKLRNGEKWGTRCRDGRYARVLETPGTYHLEVVAAGHPKQVQQVEVRGPTRVDFRLPKKASRKALCARWR